MESLNCKKIFKKPTAAGPEGLNRGSLHAHAQRSAQSHLPATRAGQVACSSPTLAGVAISFLTPAEETEGRQWSLQGASFPERSASECP